ncbi:MAG: hypothetical protein LBB77_12010 [Treponema sp.]|jgi:hypothetical protein|nr:hypothetical protein [Treponema sp.]
MRRMFLVWALLACLLPLGAQSAERTEFRSPGRFRSLGRSGPIDINLIIDGSLYIGETGARAWICEQLVDGMLQEGDYLRIWIAGDEAAILYQGILEAGGREAVKDLIQRPPPGSLSADFAGALRAALEAGVSENRSPLMTYTLLVSSSKALSPAHIGAALPYLRYSRVLDFSGWRALVIALDIGQQVREAADSFLSDR